MARLVRWSDTFALCAGRIRDVFNQPPVAANHMGIEGIRRDTRAWRVQVWISFVVAVLLCAGGLAWLPGGGIDRAFMVMGYAFCLSSAFAVAKSVRDNAAARRDLPLWGAVVWGGFACAVALTGWGLWRMQINPAWKAYLLVCWLFLISSAFTLAKTLRDAYEAERPEALRGANVTAAS